jgi:hypothetical protein
VRPRPAATVLLLALVASPAAAQQVTLATPDPQPGRQIVWRIETPASWETTAVTFEGRGLSRDTFLHRARPQTFECPAAVRCFDAVMTLDPRLTPQEYPVTFSAVDAQGRTRTLSTRLSVIAPPDDDHDGLPDPWELSMNLSTARATGGDGPDGDPDRDGVSNLEEFRRGTHATARYVRYFGESSMGDRQHVLPCFYTVQPEQRDGSIRVRLIGDEGREVVTTNVYVLASFRSCPAPLEDYVAARVVAATVESEFPLAVERTFSYQPDRFSLSMLSSQDALAAPSAEWHFAEGSSGGPVDVFLLAYNPQDAPVRATYTFYRRAGEPPVVVTRTLPPRVRTTLWVDADEARVADADFAVAIHASQPIFMDRGLRWQPPGRTAPHDAVSRGATAPAGRWYFPHLDGTRQSTEQILLANPGDRPAAVQLRVFQRGRAERMLRVEVGPTTRTAVRAADLGGDAAVAVIATCTNAVPIVAELAQRGPGSPAGWWEHVAPGALATSADWVLPNVRGGGASYGIAILNPSATDTPIELGGRYPSGTYDRDAIDRVRVRVAAGELRVVPSAEYLPGPGRGVPDAFSDRDYAVIVRSVPIGGGDPVPVVVARTSTIQAGIAAGRVEHTLAVPLPVETRIAALARQPRRKSPIVLSAGIVVKVSPAPGVIRLPDGALHARLRRIARAANEAGVALSFVNVPRADPWALVPRHLGSAGQSSPAMPTARPCRAAASNPPP